MHLVLISLVYKHEHMNKHAVLISSAWWIPQNFSYNAVEEATQLNEEHLSAAKQRSASLSPLETF
jgi:hypothetical protein